MDDSGAILCQISYLKDMLDQVNEEIEANIQVTRHIESEIVQCTELESSLAIRESDLAKSLYVSQFEISGLVSVTDDSRRSVKLLEDELGSLRDKKDEMLQRISIKREQFTLLCIEFQKGIDRGENDELVKLLSEKEFLENEIGLLGQNNYALKNSMLAFVDDVLQDLQASNYALHVEIQNMNHENEKLLKEIDDLKAAFVSDFNYS
ncbi:uncharacterized protein LOC126686225 [Mercurialis annua]|uniref:uncharacterized protein LOC126686225 n=1 Tax=Mercurialis annua TaxID=3986 RepID=UPI0021606C69|nr:uncharacterized protein LOC126686225 [Mercurialis annua]